jgi:F0F1-type ATP synthase assembly protein I
VTQLTVSTFGLGFLGYELDARFHTEPWLLLTGFVGGFAVGMILFFRGLARLQADDDDEPSDPPE